MRKLLRVPIKNSKMMLLLLAAEPNVFIIFRQANILLLF